VTSWQYAWLCRSVSLETRLQVGKKSLENLANIEETNQSADSMDERKRYVQYTEAKRNYETQNLIPTKGSGHGS